MADEQRAMNSTSDAIQGMSNLSRPAKSDSFSSYNLFPWDEGTVYYRRVIKREANKNRKKQLVVAWAETIRVALRQFVTLQTFILLKFWNTQLR